jgi:hypothetical protein
LHIRSREVDVTVTRAQNSDGDDIARPEAQLIPAGHLDHGDVTVAFEGNFSRLDAAIERLPLRRRDPFGRERDHRLGYELQRLSAARNVRGAIRHDDVVFHAGWRRAEWLRIAGICGRNAIPGDAACSRSDRAVMDHVARVEGDRLRAVRALHHINVALGGEPLPPFGEALIEAAPAFIRVAGAVQLDRTGSRRLRQKTTRRFA